MMDEYNADPPRPERFSDGVGSDFGGENAGTAHIRMGLRLGHAAFDGHGVTGRHQGPCGPGRAAPHEHLCDCLVREEDSGGGYAGGANHHHPSGGGVDAGHGLNDLKLSDWVRLSASKFGWQLHGREAGLLHRGDRGLG